MYKIDLINNAYSQLRISGILTGDPSPGEIDLALDRLETMAHEYKGRNICVGYNFEDEPDTASLHNIERRYWYAFETGLAMRLIVDYGKEIPQSLVMNHQAAYSFLAGATHRVPETSYPSRMPLGRGNRRIWNRQQYFPPIVAADPACDVSCRMYVDDIKTFTENFTAFLEDLESITSYTLDVDDGLEIVEESLDSPNVNYKLKALTAGIQNIKIVGTAQTDDYVEVPELTFRADYETTFNGIYGLGDVTGTAYGSVTITNGMLDFTAVGAERIEYSGNNMPNGNVCCIRITYIPNYDGSPVATPYNIFAASYDGTNTNKIIIDHSDVGTLRAYVYDATATLLFALSSAYTAVSGVGIEIELNIDLDTGNTNLFVDGTLVDTDSTLGNCGDREEMYVGSEGLASNYYIDDITIYNAVQHTADYTVSEFQDLELETRVETRIKQIEVIEAPL